MAGRSAAVAAPVGLSIALSVPPVESSDGNGPQPATASQVESAQTSRAQDGLISPTKGGLLDDYSTRRSCDGAIRGDEGKTTSAPLTVW